jgi:hypothetical protein
MVYDGIATLDNGLCVVLWTVREVIEKIRLWESERSMNVPTCIIVPSREHQRLKARQIIQTRDSEVLLGSIPISFLLCPSSHLSLDH